MTESLSVTEDGPYLPTAGQCSYTLYHLTVTVLSLDCTVLYCHSHCPVYCALNSVQAASRTTTAKTTTTQQQQQDSQAVQSEVAVELHSGL